MRTTAFDLAIRCSLAALVGGCGNELVGGAGSTTTAATDDDSNPTITSTTITASSTVSTTDSGPCPVGGAGCACTDGGACDPGLECVGDVCSDPACPVGSAGCACTAGGSCDADLECVGDNCVDPGGAEGCPIGSAGCPCTAGGSCDAGLQCEAGSCVDDPPAESSSADSATSVGPGSSSAEGVDLDCGNGLIDDGEQCDDGDDVQGNGCNNDCQDSAAEVWTIGYAGPDGLDDQANSVAAFANGDFVVTGYRGVAGAGYDIVTRKYEPDGSLVWERSHDGSVNGNDFGFGVAVDPDGAVLVGGLENGAGGQVAWLRKYDTDGATIWTATGPEDAGSVANDVTVDQAGDIVVAGSANELGQGSNTWLRKYTTDGDVAWSVYEDQGSGESDVALGVHADQADNVIVVGTLVVGNASQAWARGYDADGGLLWSQEPVGTTMLLAAASAAADQIYLVGNSNAGQARLHKVNEDGQILWTQNYAPNMGYAEGHGVATDSAGAIVISGDQSIADFELLTRKYGSDGSAFWTRAYAGVADQFIAELAWDVAVDADDFVIAVGFENVAGQDDWWIRKYTP